MNADIIGTRQEVINEISRRTNGLFRYLYLWGNVKDQTYQNKVTMVSPYPPSEDDGHFYSPPCMPLITLERAWSIHITVTDDTVEWKDSLVEAIR